MEKQEIEYLKTLGFWQESEDNPLDTLIYRLDIPNHPLLSELHIIVCEGHIEVWCEQASLSGDGGDTCLAIKNYDRDKLEALIQYLS